MLHTMIFFLDLKDDLIKLNILYSLSLKREVLNLSNRTIGSDELFELWGDQILTHVQFIQRLEKRQMNLRCMMRLMTHYSIIHLDLSNTQLRSCDVSTLSPLLKDTQVSQLILKDNAIDDIGLHALCAVLPFTPIKVLNVSGNYMKGYPLLMSLYERRLGVLQSLNLSENLIPTSTVFECVNCLSDQDLKFFELSISHLSSISYESIFNSYKRLAQSGQWIQTDQMFLKDDQKKIEQEYVRSKKMLRSKQLLAFAKINLHQVKGLKDWGISIARLIRQKAPHPEVIQRMYIKPLKATQLSATQGKSNKRAQRQSDPVDLSKSSKRLNVTGF